MRVLIALDLNDDDLTEAYGSDVVQNDMVESLAARLGDEAGYFGPSNVPVRGRLVSLEIRSER